ncbi:MAG: thioredoxin family protein [Bryobacterales bacterium]|nr:thioredoxin family protein [Bryobacterales bacterium]
MLWCLCLAGAAFPAVAQRLDPVQWSLSIEPASAAPGSTVTAKATATVEAGWHLYSMTTPPPSLPTQIKLAESPVAGEIRVHQPKPERKYDPNFQSDTETFDGSVDFYVEIPIRADAPTGPAELAIEVRYNVCDDTRCLPPRRKTASAAIDIQPGASAAAQAIPAGYVVAGEEAPPPPAQATSEDEGFGAFLAVAFGFGMLAVFTPCVFPMIPMVMSFFLNQGSSNRMQSVVQAAVFCLGIVVLFTSIGLVVTAALGPFGVVQMASNPWVNGFIAAVFFTFALSMFGAFEITIPSSVLTKLNKASERGGIAGTLVMGLAFSLTSFACVGPFVGPLLAASAQGGGVRPAAGMLFFAAGLALPFFFLALFPSWLKRMPRSGGWLARVKVVMGFIIAAAMLKYLSNVDQVLQLGLLPRERFLSVWIVLFVLCGLYLLGFVRLPGVSRDDELGVGRLFTATAFLAVAISLVPGMFGGRLGELDAIVPLPAEGGFAAAGGGQSLVWEKNDLPGALARARSEGKLVFVNFTGYTCTNCHWMKANMFTRPEIAAEMDRFVLVELYTDERNEAIAQANQDLQDSKFQTIAIPFYAILDPDEKVVASFPGLTRDPARFLEFLKAGTSRMRG